MADDYHRQPLRSVRVPTGRWTRFKASADAADTTRNQVLNAFMAYWTHEPGAKLPKRPPEPDTGE